jgi:type II secretory pathway pseudopilin PulG
MKKKKLRRNVTLIEIMIVILLIGIIGGALAFNMRGSLDHGRKFKTEQNIARVKDILNMEYAKGDISPEDIAKNWEKIVAESPLANGTATTLDAWKNKLIVEFNNDSFEVKKKESK